MSIEIKLSFLAVSLEVSAVALLSQGNSLAILGGFFLLHMLACAMITPVAWLLMPVRYRYPMLWVILFLFSVCFFIPILGLFGFLISVIVALWLPSRASKYDFTVINPPRHEETHALAKHKPRTNMAKQLRNESLPLEFRLKALTSIQDKDTHYTSHLLRDTLGDNSDDLRLLAYGILASKEKMVTQRIHDARANLQRAKAKGESDASFGFSRELAELYWELVYQNLVQGSIISFSLEQVQHYVSESLKYRPNDAGLYILSGRAHLQAGDWDKATIAFNKAQALNAPYVQVNSYLAELAFLTKDFTAVRGFMKNIHSQSRMPRLQQTLAYWVKD